MVAFNVSIWIYNIDNYGFRFIQFVNVNIQ